MITFKQFLTEAISKDSFEGNLPQSEFKRIGRRLAQYGVNFDKLKFKRAEPNQFKIASAYSASAWNAGYKFSTLPTEYMEADMKLRHAAKRRVITLVSVNPTDQSYAVFVVWGTGRNQCVQVQSSDSSFNPRKNKAYYGDKNKAYLQNKDVIKYYAYTSPVDVQKFTEQRKEHVKSYQSRIESFVKESAFYKKLDAFCKKHDLKLNDLYMFNDDGSKVVPFEVFGSAYSQHVMWIVDISAAKKDIDINYKIKYRNGDHWKLFCKQHDNKQWYFSGEDELSDQREKEVRDEYIKRDSDNEQYYNTVYKTRKLINKCLKDFVPDFVKLMNELTAFVEEQGFNIN